MSGIRKPENLACMLLLLVAMAAPAMPAEAARETEICKGTIRVLLTDGGEGTSKEGVEIFCERAAEIQNGEYVLTGRYKSADTDLNQIKNAAELEEAAGILAEVSSHMEPSSLKTEETDQEGVAVFQGLEEGVYLLQSKGADNYDAIAPVLVAVPGWKEENGTQVFDIEVIPKHSTERETAGQNNPAPETGDSISSLPQFAGAMLASASALLILGKKAE